MTSSWSLRRWQWGQPGSCRTTGTLVSIRWAARLAHAHQGRKRSSETRVPLRRCLTSQARSESGPGCWCGFALGSLVGSWRGQTYVVSGEDTDTRPLTTGPQDQGTSCRSFASFVVPAPLHALGHGRTGTLDFFPFRVLRVFRGFPRYSKLIQA